MESDDEVKPTDFQRGKRFNKDGDQDEPSLKPTTKIRSKNVCPWCGEESECTPECRSQYPNGERPDFEWQGPDGGTAA